MRDRSVIFVVEEGGRAAFRRLGLAVGAGMMFATAPLHAQSLDRGALTAAVSDPSPAPANGGRSAKEGPLTAANPGAAATTERVVITDEGVPSAYGAPSAFSRSRFSNLTNAYVLPPFAVYAGLIYEGDAIRYDHPDHLFTQEIELGLPHRFGIAIENGEEAYRHRGQETTLSFEARYALADWNKIPLNPTLFVEYRKGLGHIFRDEGVPMRRDKGGEGEGDDENEDAGGRPRFPDAVEMRLLLAQDFGHKVEWATNFFFELEVQGDRGREWGFAQSLLLPVFLPNERLKLGLEMQYSNFTDKDTRDDPANRFVIGPTIAFKPSRNTRVDLSPLIGATFDAPRFQGFAVFSYTFGPGGEGNEAEAPASTRNR